MGPVRSQAPAHVVQRRLTLLGDAAHPMLPHLGQGANQAIEDGVALSILLEGRSAGEVPGALRAYESLRRPRTSMVQSESRRNGMRYDSQYPSIESATKKSGTSRRFA